MKPFIDNDKRYHRLFKNAPTGVGIFTPEGKILACNRQMASMLGYAPDEPVRINSRQVLKNPNDVQRILKQLTDQGGARNQELELRRKDGSSFPAVANVHPFQCGEKMAVMGIIQDPGVVREMADARHDLEKKLCHAQNMEALGTLAGGIAHDLNNALGIILANTELLRSDFEPDSPTAFNLDLILKAANRSRRLAEQILTFSRRTEEGFVSLNPDSLLREAIKMLRSCLPATIEIRQDIRGGDANIFADPFQIHQVILSLAAHASQAIPSEGGILEIALFPVELSEPIETFTKTVGPGNFLQLVVRDNGRGLDPATLQEIFDPFFHGDREPGMGLSAVHGIMANHAGGITVASPTGQGTSVNLYFPMVGEPPRPFEIRYEDLPCGTEKILFVDDEKDMIQSVTKILQRFGYTATSCGNGREAWERFRQDPSAFDLLITDQTMPGLTGLDLIKHVRAVRPGLPVILCTGFSEAIDCTTKSAAGVNEILSKPIAMQTWAQTIRRVLDESV